MNSVPDAWEDEWSSTADKSATPQGTVEVKKPTTKVSKAQRRAQQAEFNKQLWAEAEGPKETNFFLESRNAPPLRSEFKPPPILLSRKGPATKPSKTPTNGVQSLSLNHESSEDDEEAAAKELMLAQRQAQATRDREEKQRKYEERRQELFGTTNTATTTVQSVPTNMSGTYSPLNLTPPGSRSATPNRGGRGRGGRRGGAGVAGGGGTTQSQHRAQPHQQRELFDPSPYAAKPDSTYIQRRENGGGGSRITQAQPQSQPRSGLGSDDVVIHPIRTPRGPDSSGRGGFGFAGGSRGGSGGGGKQSGGTVTATTTRAATDTASHKPTKEESWTT